MPRNELLTLPNAISALRLLLAPLFLVAARAETRAVLVIAAAASDMLDGWLARRRRMASRAGAIIDPVADRVFVLTALVTLLLEGALSVGQALVLLSRDVMTTIGFVVARSVSWLRPVELRARMAGKVVTVLQVATLLAILLYPRVVPPLVIATGAAAAVSVADYTLALWRARTT